MNFIIQKKQYIKSRSTTAEIKKAESCLLKAIKRNAINECCINKVVIKLHTTSLVVRNDEGSGGKR